MKLYLPEQFTLVSDANARAVYAALATMPPGARVTLRAERVEALFTAPGDTVTYARHVARAVVPCVEDPAQPQAYEFEIERIDRGDEEDVEDILYLVFRENGVTVSAVECYKKQSGERVQMSLEQYDCSKKRRSRFYIARHTDIPSPLLAA
jgi:hypothetical protein